MNKSEIRKIKIDIINEKYKCISAYKIPDKLELWLKCPNCNLKPLVWEFDNGRSTACGCGENEYNHFSIVAESVRSVAERCNGSVIHYNIDELLTNWNHWVKTGEFRITNKELVDTSRW